MKCESKAVRFGESHDPVATCTACGAEEETKVTRTRSGNVAVAFLPDGWRLGDDRVSAICGKCGGDDGN